jgi:hypothetical protein
MKNNQIINFPTEKKKEIINLTKKEDREYYYFELEIKEEDINKIFEETRLTEEEYMEAIHSFLSAEKDDWSSLKMKEQIEMTKLSIMEKAFEKHAKKEFKINFEKADIKDVNYEKTNNKTNIFMKYVFKK